MDEFANLEKLLVKKKPICCEKCGGKLFYKGSGTYVCEDCGFKMLDDFGKIRQYTELYGPAPMAVIAKATGVSKEVITSYLKSGRMEIPEGSKYYLQCEKCGCSIRSGRICERCASGSSSDARAIFRADVGDRPKSISNDAQDRNGGQMHFIGRRDNWRK